LVLKYDIRDFFGSVTRERVYRTYRRVGYSPQIAQLLTVLTTLDGVLPQGAPTSPDLANHTAYHLDVRLAHFATRNILTYTRYADDLTFSGDYIQVARTKRTIEHIMRAEGFAPNERKLRLVPPGARHHVTGVIVNEKLNWPRERRRWLRQEIYYLGRYGVGGHLGRRDLAKAVGYKEFLYGHVAALAMVLPDEAAAHLENLDAIAWTY
jgi:RNA-directed DNA polymerase